MSQKEYVPIDALLAQIAAVPKVQRAIIHATLTEELKLDPTLTSMINHQRAVWLYNGLEE